jgi:hypothetical protein
MFTASNAELRSMLETRAKSSLSKAREMIDCSSIESVEVLLFFLNHVDHVLLNQYYFVLGSKYTFKD